MERSPEQNHRFQLDMNPWPFGSEPTKLTTRRLWAENCYQKLCLFLLKKKCFQVFNKVSALGRSFSDWWTRKMSCNDTSTDTSNLFRHNFVTTLARTVRWWHHLVVIMETNQIVFQLQQQVVTLTDMFFRRIRACRKNSWTKTFRCFKHLCMCLSKMAQKTKYFFAWQAN